MEIKRKYFSIQAVLTVLFVLIVFFPVSANKSDVQNSGASIISKISLCDWHKKHLDADNYLKHPLILREVGLSSSSKFIGIVKPSGNNFDFNAIDCFKFPKLNLRLVTNISSVLRNKAPPLPVPVNGNA